MPKSKITLPNRKMVTRRVKFKMGGRSSTTSAHEMSTEALTAILNDPTAGRKRPKASQILDQRAARAAVAA